MAGILTGIGFIGAGLVFVHGATIRGLDLGRHRLRRGRASGSSSATGICTWVCSSPSAFLFMLELQHIPGLRFLDASTYADRFANDYDGATARAGDRILADGDGAGRAVRPRRAHRAHRVPHRRARRTEPAAPAGPPLSRPHPAGRTLTPAANARRTRGP